MLKTKVILSRVSNLSDARYAAGMGVNYIGFSINPENSSYVTVDQAKTISNWLSGVSIIGEIGNSVTADMADYATAHIQTSATSLIDELEKPLLVLDIGTENMQEVIDLMPNYSSHVNFFILKVAAEQLSTLKPQLSDLCLNNQVYISTQFDEQKLAFVLSEIQPTGIVLYGSKEVHPGLSSYDGIADILELLEEE